MTTELIALNKSLLEFKHKYSDCLSYDELAVIQMLLDILLNRMQEELEDE